jgi:signal peptide peptidase SppA
MITSIETLTLATSELWCIAPGYARASNRAAVQLPSRSQAVGKGVAVVELVGTLTKQVTLPIRNRISQLAGDNAIGEIVLIVDSPGGTVSGTHDLYSIISRAAKRKRVTAVIEDLACSGAIYAISGANEIVIGETALTGSIGVFQVVIDESKLLERIGVEIIVIRSGEHKGAGVSGAKLTADQLTELKRRVDVQARHFVAAIARGRKMDPKKAADLADGRVFVGSEAVAAGLADRVGMVEDVLSEAQQRGQLHWINGLTGAEAAEKFAELMQIEIKKDGDKYRAETDIERRYPQLVPEAKAYRYPPKWEP